MRVTYRCKQPEIEDAVRRFFADWESGQAVFEVRTSGSTGPPKTVFLRREQLIASAQRTINHFGLTPGDTALLALPPHTIAGKMMLVRAIVGQLHLLITDPGAQPLSCLEAGERLRFCPLSPVQLRALVEHPDRLRQIDTILLGGAPLSAALEQRIEQLHPECYIGFGMTETVSHVALRKAGNPVYRALEGVVFSSRDGQLEITDRHLGLEQLLTNDLVELQYSGSFRWLGRADFVINSGGIKIYPEQLEQLLGEWVTGDFFIAGVPDATFGEKCIMVADTMTIIQDFEQLQQRCKTQFGAYSAPKLLYRTSLIYSSGTKINRRLTLQQLNLSE